MRRVYRVVLLAILGVAVVGCGQRKPFDGPTVETFVGRVTQDGQPVSFPEGEEVTLRVFLHGKGQRFGIPLKSDGTFDIGWMPIGKYSVMLERGAKDGRGAPSMYRVPDVTIEEGQTQYTIELGKDWKP
jgi:hypothetical protein